MSHLLLPKQPLAWRMRVRFAGKLPPREYVTPDVRNADPGWGDEIFNRQMTSLEFHLPTGHRIVLAGMQAYNFFVEATQSFSRQGGARIEAFWLAGKLPGQPLVELWRIGNGQVTRNRKPWGEEWGGTATSGWKPGAVGCKTISELIPPSYRGEKWVG